MLRLREFFGGSANRWFVSTRGISTGLALGLALSYTKVLGVDKRSILAFIMVSALILTFIFISGISLALRNNPPNQIKNEELLGFLVLVALAGLIVAVLNCALLIIYSHLKTDIPGPIYIVCFIYSFLACLNLGYQDALIAIGNIKLATIFDIITILVQIFALTFFISLNQTSLIISVFISFIFSYTLISFATASIFLNSLRLESQTLLIGIKQIFLSSRKQHMFGIANGLVDRIDRFIIGLVLPISFLAKYALLSSIISFARFFPDAAVKLNLLRHHQGKSKQNIILKPSTLVAVIVTGIALIISAQGFINLAFGQVWLLPIYVGLLFVMQEILRGYYQITAVQLIAIGGKSEMSQISMLLIILTITCITIGTIIFGIVGAPAAMVLIYLTLISLVKTRIKRLSSVD